MSESDDITVILQDASLGRREALDQLMPRVYDELRRLAQHMLDDERPDHTLQATALVHEAYTKLVDQNRVTWQNRAHFFAVAAQSIRRILIDHARARNRAKRGSGHASVELDAAMNVPDSPTFVDLIGLDDALSRLAVDHPGPARVVEMRYFAGLSHAETGEVLGVGQRTAERYWQFARAWLYRELGASDRSP